jgi:hypothetical protein
MLLVSCAVIVGAYILMVRVEAVLIPVLLLKRELC